MPGSEQRYQAFGLSWHSPQLAMPELPAEGGGPLVEVVPGDPQHWPPLPAGRHDTPFVRMAPGELQLTVEGIGRFRVSGGERISWWREHEGVSDQDIRTFLLGSAVGALLIQRGLLVLHGNALERGGEAIVCLGHSGAGKSTLAYALLQQGWRLLADDLVAISPDGLVLPGIPRIKLWHDAARAFGLDPEQLPQMRQGMHKYLLMGQEIRRAEQPTPLSALYRIQRRRPNDRPASAGDDNPIQPILSQKANTLMLRNQAFRPRFVRGLGQEGPNFMALTRLQRTVPAAFLTLPFGIAAMGEWLDRQELATAATEALVEARLREAKATTAAAASAAAPVEVG
jgi:hypothetical protein